MPINNEPLQTDALLRVFKFMVQQQDSLPGELVALPMEEGVRFCSMLQCSNSLKNSKTGKERAEWNIS